MYHQNPSTSSHGHLSLKFGSLETLRRAIISSLQLVSASAGVADAATEDIRNNIKPGLLKRRCEAQLGPTTGIVKPGGGIRTWKRPLLPSRKLSRPGRLVKALGHHTMQPNALPDMQCTVLAKKPTRRSKRILTPSLQKSIALLTSLEERMLMLFVTNQ